jgi:CDP-glycerol glycerophosphotransferase
MRNKVSLISIVVPIYNVQSYLRACLDSILDQDFKDIEVIAVNDRSPDGCGQIIDEYARKDYRVQAVHLPENVGLGRARNAGLALATGDYVWFVDSDDLITEGSLGRIAARIRATTPDVLLVDYARTYWRGDQVRNKLHTLLSKPGAPDVFHISERADLLRVFPVAWNKVIRRQFMLETGIEFPAGWYEDLAFTYPIFAKAERIAILDYVSILYRQRRHGAILGTSSDRHFELFAQYDLVLERLAAAGEQGAKIRRIVLGLAMEHLIVVLGHPNRLSRRVKHRFFREIIKFRRRHVGKDGYVMPREASPIRHKVIAIGSWPLYRSMRAAYMLRNRTKGTIKSVLNKTRKRAGLVSKGLRVLYYKAAVRVLPIDPKLAVYSIYWGRGYGCNPAAIYERAKTVAPDVHGVWIVNRNGTPDMPPGVDYAVDHSLKYFRVMAQAKYFFNNVNFPDHLVKRAGTVHVQTHHGTALKSMGIDGMNYALTDGEDFDGLLRRSDRWDFSIVSNSYSTEVWGRAFPCSYTTLEYGYPRNDVLSTATTADILKIRADLGLAPHHRVVLYAPTHRDYAKGYRDLLDLERLAEQAGPDTVILMRAHHFYANQTDAASTSRVINVTDYRRVEELYLAADVLITDYSSVMFDYGVLDRPIVIFAPDWEVYRATRGTYFDLMEEPPGAVARTQDELLRIFATGRFDTAETTLARTAFRARFCHLDDGRAAERVVRRTILGDVAA